MTQLALTFDDGPSDWTPEVVRILNEHDARAAFFVIGEWAAQRPDLVRELAARGHDVGNHTYTHVPQGDLCDLSDEEIEDELRRTNAAIEAALGRPPRLFRAPAFGKDERVLEVVRRLGLVDVDCDVNPEDWRSGLDAAAIVKHVLANAAPRAIVDLHDGYPPYWGRARRDCTPTVEALRILLPELRGRGYEVVSVSELLSAAPPA